MMGVGAAPDCRVSNAVIKGIRATENIFSEIRSCFHDKNISFCKIGYSL